MMKVFKYPIDITNYQSVAMLKKAEILNAQVHNGQTCIWALVDPKAEIEERKFRVVVTGHPISGKEAMSLVYVVTLQMHLSITNIGRIEK